MIIANYMATQTPLDEVWMVVSPQNPLKPKATLASDYDRLHLVQLAIGDNPRLRASDIEFGLPKPSYTIDTLAYLREKHPHAAFVLIMGSDNLDTFFRWKHYELLLWDYRIFAYKRPNHSGGELAGHPNVRIFEAPLMFLSATYIRKCLRQGKSVQYLVPDAVFEYLQQTSLYR
jgi:nicotinate-nucleotide adenylyltransferase